jgi:hypothetical protein
MASRLAAKGAAAERPRVEERESEDAPAPEREIPVELRDDGSSASWPLARRLLASASRYLGTRYVWGGTAPGGFDCSGFTRYVYAHFGVRLPRTSREQVYEGEEVQPHPRWLRPGDLLFFARSPSSAISHVAIYAGQNRFIHASSSGHAVRFDDLESNRGRWFATHMVAARRIIPAVDDSADSDAAFLRALGTVAPKGGPTP